MQKSIECEGFQDQDDAAITVVTITCSIPYRKLLMYTVTHTSM